MLTNPPEVCKPRGGFYLPQKFRCACRARLLPDYGETGSRPDMYLLIKRACRRGLLGASKEAGTTAGAEELFASYLAACAGRSFTEIRGASSRSPGRRFPQLRTATIATRRTLDSLRRCTARTSAENSSEGRTRARSGASRPASGRWRVRLGGRRATTATQRGAAHSE
jgi:hypothetical protein